MLESYRRPGSPSTRPRRSPSSSRPSARAPCPIFSRAVDGPDRAFRGAALALAERIPGNEATLRWVEKAGAAPPDVRADVVAMLGRRGDAAALPVRPGEPPQRGRGRAPRGHPRRGPPRRRGRAPRPLPLLGSAGAGESAVLKTALLGYPATLVVPEAVRLLDSAPPPAKAVLVEVLGEKGARGEIERVYRLAEDADPAMREAALAALGQARRGRRRPAPRRDAGEGDRERRRRPPAGSDRGGRPPEPRSRAERPTASSTC